MSVMAVTLLLLLLLQLLHLTNMRDEALAARLMLTWQRCEVAVEAKRVLDFHEQT